MYIFYDLLMNSSTGVFHETSTFALYVKILGTLDGNGVYMSSSYNIILSTLFCFPSYNFLFLFLCSKSQYFCAPLSTKHGPVLFIQVLLFYFYYCCLLFILFIRTLSHLSCWDVWIIKICLCYCAILRKKNVKICL